MAKYLTKSKAQKALPKAVRDVYEIGDLPSIQAYKFSTKYGVIDLQNIRLSQVKALVECGCNIFVEKVDDPA